jgi:2-polyprenyl-6-methoxyphenol hydroxylase-like FAD-dependent oxidoreductase
LGTATFGLRKVLVSGASVAGPALAYWLRQYGFDVTVVERASSLRSGGYAIDIRGSAVHVVDRMGLLPALRAAHVRTGRVTFRHPNSKLIGVVKPEDIVGGTAGWDLELPRGQLTSLLYELTRGSVTYRFNDSIASLSDHAEGVDVVFRNGEEQRYDVLAVAEGLHSKTRSVVFGSEDEFSRYLGYCFGLFTIPNVFGLSREAVLYNVPGKAAATYNIGDQPNAYVLLVVRRPPPSSTEMDDPTLPRRIVLQPFSGQSWLTPQVRAMLETADDFYFDTTSRIYMPTWSRGRVVLLGDAGYAPSFFSGQGTSIALVGAYVLAGELATRRDHADAFRAYETTARPYIEANQAIAKEGIGTVAPATRTQLWIRNQMIRLSPMLVSLGLIHSKPSKAYGAFEIPDYAAKRHANLM